MLNGLLLINGLPFTVNVTQLLLLVLSRPEIGVLIARANTEFILAGVFNS